MLTILEALVIWLIQIIKSPEMKSVSRRMLTAADIRYIDPVILPACCLLERQTKVRERSFTIKEKAPYMAYSSGLKTPTRAFTIKTLLFKTLC